MFIFQAKNLEKLGTEIFRVQGMPLERAKFIAKTLIEASLTGHDSHGVYYFVRYSERIRDGSIDPLAKPRIIKETASTALIDGHWAPGQIIAMDAVKNAVEKAKMHGISAVGCFRCNHIGRVGYYTNWAAAQGVVALMFVNVGNQNVTIFNGMERAFGTNPFSAAVPTGNFKPFLIDYATSVVADGKINVARSKGEKIPTHWSRNKKGEITDDPYAIKEGGWLLPFGEHKGYCLQILMELLGAIMTGSRSGFDEEEMPPSTNGVFVIAFDPEAFVGLDAFLKRTDDLLQKVKKIKPEPGKRALIPGEPEWETREKRLKKGIPIPEDTWNQILELADVLGIEVHV
jgi:LDH2 family malate/lactate/ureidoglycolate dehydrogenase